MAPKLVENGQYLFRVFAENDVGIGEAVEITQPITAKNTFGKNSRVLGFLLENQNT